MNITIRRIVISPKPTSSIVPGPPVHA